MKKAIICLLLSSFFITSCKKETKQTEASAQEITTPIYSVDAIQLR